MPTSNFSGSQNNIRKPRKLWYIQASNLPRSWYEKVYIIGCGTKSHQSSFSNTNYMPNTTLIIIIVTIITTTEWATSGPFPWPVPSHPHPCNISAPSFRSHNELLHFSPAWALCLLTGTGPYQAIFSIAAHNKSCGDIVWRGEGSM